MRVDEEDDETGLATACIEAMLDVVVVAPRCRLFTRKLGSYRALCFFASRDWNFLWFLKAICLRIYSRSGFMVS